MKTLCFFIKYVIMFLIANVGCFPLSEYDTNIEGEVLGEKVDPFSEIPVSEDGCLTYSFGMMTLERA